LKAKDNLVIGEALSLLKEAGGKVGLLEAVRQFTEAQKLLGSQSSVVQGVKEFKAQLEKGKLPEITVPELIPIFLAEVEKEGNTRRYKMDIRQKLNIAAKTFTGQVADVKVQEIDNWLDGLKGVSKRTAKNYRNALRTLFSFAKKKGYLHRHVDTEVQFSREYKPGKPVIGIYTPEQLKILLFNITPRLVPFVAIGGLSGMRSAEIVRMQWGDIRLDTNQIFVPEPVAKTIAREIPICPALAAWLKPFKDASEGEDKVLPRITNEFALAKRMASAVGRMKGKNGKPLLKIVHNGLRHTYISCRVKNIKNKHEVALEAGNSPRIIDSNYLKVIENPEQAKEWFNVFPTEERLKELSLAIEEGL
jgi:integrase